MAHESIRRPDFEAEPQVDSHVEWLKSRRETLARATETLRDVGALGLLVILAAEESVRHRRAPPPDDIEQLCQYGDWID